MTAHVAAAEQGPHVGAFFDFDGTLIDGFSAFSYLADRNERGDLPLEEALDLAAGMVAASRGRLDFDRFMRRSCEPFRGQDVVTLAELGERLYERRLAPAMLPGAVEVVQAHQAAGHTVALATSALPFQVEPAARVLGIEHVLCTRLEERGGVCTGRVDGRILWGAGKAAAVVEFAGRADIDLAASFAYGNGDEDLDFLRTVGHPQPTNPKPKGELMRVARDEGWPVHVFAPTRRPGRLERLARLARGFGRETMKALGPG